MSISSVIQSAQNSLANMTRRTGILARNVNEANNVNYSRRDLQTITGIYGSQTADIQRATSKGLEKYALTSTSAYSGNKVVSEGLQGLKSLVADENGDLLISSQLIALNNSIQTFGNAPGNGLLAEAAIGKAKDVVQALNSAATGVQELRLSTDKQIAVTVKELNSLLADFKTTNDQIRLGVGLGNDVNDALDARSEMLGKISEIVPISYFERNGGDMVLLTASGATLFETAPRSVGFEAQTSFAPGTSGADVYIDAIKLAPAPQSQDETPGKLAALMRLRDGIAPGLQKKLDELARSLIAGFAETDVTGGGLAPLQGLFSWSGGPAFPSAGSLVDGISLRIAVNPAYDPASGGNAFRLRDGGANGSAYLENPNGNSGYSTRLIELFGSFDEKQIFDSEAGLGVSLTVHEFANASSSWLAGLGSAAQQNLIASEAKTARAKEALANETGVNIDQEMVKLGELEQSYEASTRLLRAANDMLQSLLDAVG